MSDLMLLLSSSVATGGLAALGWPKAVEFLRKSDHGTVSALCREAETVGFDSAGIPGQALMWRSMSLALLIGLSVVGQAPLAIVLAVLVILGSNSWIRHRIGVHQRAVAEQVVEFCRDISGRVRVGIPLQAAFLDAAKVAPLPLGIHLRETARRMAQGSSTVAALEALRERVQVDAVAMMVTALQVADVRGGKPASVLDRIAETTEEMARVRRKRDVDTAAGRRSILVMAIVPPAFLGLVLFVDPDLVFGAFSTLLGRVVLAAVAGVVYASVRWGMRIYSPHHSPENKS